jgi:3-dehydroquinate synthase
MKEAHPFAQRVNVAVSGGDGYPIFVGPGSLEHLADLLSRYAPAFRYAVIADARVADLHRAEIEKALGGLAAEVSWFTFPPGEAEKTRDQWARLTDALLDRGLGRDSCVLAVGGGVAGDLAGFVAATYLRGIPVVQIPTSLVAMIDSSVGGKTGVDTRHGKNLVGAFHPPAMVLIDPRLARTLPRIERAQGLAEAIKHGAILDRPYLEALEHAAPGLLAGDEMATTACVVGSVRHKAAVVQEDEREGGIRKILNFGHTLGHAIEQLSGYAVPHGLAVAWGMVLEARVGERLGVTEPGTAAMLARILRLFELDWERVPRFAPDALVAATRTDKKAREGAVHYVLLRKLGVVARDPDWSRPVPVAVVLDVLQSLDGEA